MASIADTLGRGFSRALTWAEWWRGAGKRPGGIVTVEVNKDFTEAHLPAKDVVALVSAWQSGGLGLDALHWNLQRGEALPEDMDAARFRQDIEDNGPAAVMGFMNGADEDEETLQ